MATTKKVEYRKSPEYRTLVATGAWGGPSPSGHVIFDLFIERFLLPTEENLIIDEITGTAHPSLGVDTNILRESQVGVVLRADVAYLIGKFLMEKAQAAGFTPPADDN